MNIAIRDEVLLQAFPNIEEGLNYLSLNHFELHLDNAFHVYNLNSNAKISLNSDEQLSSFKENLQERGFEVSALLTGWDISMYSVEQTLHGLNKQSISLMCCMQRQSVWTPYYSKNTYTPSAKR